MAKPATPKKPGMTVAYEKLHRAVAALHKTIDGGLRGPEMLDRIEKIDPLYRDFYADEKRRAATALPAARIGDALPDPVSMFLDKDESKGYRPGKVRDPRSISRKEFKTAYVKAVTVDVRDESALIELSPSLATDEMRAKLKAFQDLHDAFAFTYFAHIKEQDYDHRESKRFGLYKALHDELVCKNILTTVAAGAGAEFIPTLLSGQLIPLFRQALVVAADFPRYPMSGKTEELPLQGVSPFMHFVPESSSSAPPTSGNQIPTLDLATGKITLVAKKLAGIAVVSSEATEDSVMNMLPFMRAEMAQSGAETLDSSLINGDASSTHMDDDVAAAAATNHQKIWNGLRKLSHAEAKVNVNGILTSAKIAQVLTAFGKFSSFPDQISTFTSSVAHVQLSRDTQYLGRDKMDAQSTLLTGQVGVCMGTRVQVSGHVRRDLDADGTDNTESGSLTDRTIAVVAHRPSFLIGDRRIMVIDQVKDIWQDTVVLMTSMRNDFVRRQAESSFNRNVGVLHNITTATTLT